MKKSRAGDKLVITGTHKTVEDAVKYLNDEMKDQDTLALMTIKFFKPYCQRRRGINSAPSHTLPASRAIRKPRPK